MGYWKRHFSSKHLDSGDLTEAQKANIKIVAIGDSDEEDTDGEKKMKITFKAGADFEKQMLANSNAKPPKAKTTWVCSRTIGYCLEKMFGDDDAAWIGKIIVVYAAKIRDGEAVRVWGSPHIKEEMTVKVRDFGGKKTWTLHPTAKPQTDNGQPVPPAGDA